MLVFVGGLIGAELAPSLAWATLPISIQIVGVAVFTFPAALLMRRIGRRKGFLTAAFVAGLASLLGAIALVREDFFLYCAASFIFGATNAFTQQYRFAAVESVEPRYSGRAVSFVLVGGILAGFLGPEIARRTENMIHAAPFAASFLSLALLYLIVFCLLLFFKNVRPLQAEVDGEERPLREIVLQPVYIVALMAGALGYGVMSFIMTATPIEMHINHGYSISETAWVIQSHVIAMFLPSLFSGFIIERLGVFRVILGGLLCLMATVGLAVAGTELLQFWWSLVLLGLGWNFMYVGGTVLLTQSYQPAERFKAQATNDFIIFGIQALTSLSAGTVLFRSNWDTLNLFNIPFILTFLIFLILFRQKITVHKESLQPAVVEGG
jgi:MFS family permease